MKIELPDFLQRVRKRLRKIPTAYTVGPVLFAIASLLLIVSLTIETGVVGTGFATGDAAPGITEREVAFRVAPLFDASLVSGMCGVEFHLLNDSAYQTFQADRSLPPPTLDCNRTEAVVEGSVGHLVINNTAPPGNPNSSYLISVVFRGPRAPYAILSVPGASLALAVTIWMSMTIMPRGTDRLIEYARLEREKRTKK